MPIASNSPLSSAVANDTFMDRTVNTDTIGQLGLLNTDPESGETITNTQARINESTLKINPSASYLSSESIALDAIHKRQYFRVAGNGTPVTLATPFNSNPKDGTEIFIVGTDDSLTVTLQQDDSTNGLYLNGDATLFRGAMIHLIYDAVLERYFEVGRNF